MKLNKIKSKEKISLNDGLNYVLFVFCLMYLLQENRAILLPILKMLCRMGPNFFAVTGLFYLLVSVLLSTILIQPCKSVKNMSSFHHLLGTD